VTRTQRGCCFCGQSATRILGYVACYWYELDSDVTLTNWYAHGQPCARQAHSSRALVSHTVPLDDLSNWWYLSKTPVLTMMAAWAVWQIACHTLNVGFG
jgi:hypothetical protein